MFEKRISRIFVVIFSIIISFLLICSLVFTSSSIVEYEEYRELTFNKPITIIALIFAGLIVFLAFDKLYDKLFYKVNINLLIVAVSGLILAIALVWSRVNASVPIGDQEILIECADHIMDEDFHDFEKGGYLSIYPQQLGMVFILTSIFRVFGHYSYYFLEAFNAFLCPIIVVAGTFVVKMISEGNAKAQYRFLLLMLAFVPMYGYIPFIYGDLAGVAFSLSGFAFFIACLKKPKVIHYFGLIISIFLAIALRRNSIIGAIAMLIVCVVKIIQELLDVKKTGKVRSYVFITLICVVIGMFANGWTMKAIYGEKYDESGMVPSTLYLVMGLNNDDGHPGWYNNFSYRTLVECNYDVNEAKRIAKDKFVTEYVPIIKENPLYFVNFGFRKVTLQWLDPMFQWNNSTYSSRADITDFENEVRNGETYQVMFLFMKAYQILAFAFVLWWVIKKTKTEGKMDVFSPLVMVVGGFLFTIIWEAKTRYILPYFVLLIPYFAVSIGYFTEALDFSSLFRRRRIEG